MRLKMDNTKKQCQSCKFFSRSGSKGYCHRYPPQACVVDEDEQGKLTTLYRIPEVHENGYCGEWQNARKKTQAEELVMSESLKQY
jgi:hypothetical protein